MLIVTHSKTYQLLARIGVFAPTLRATKADDHLTLLWQLNVMFVSQGSLMDRHLFRKALRDAIDSSGQVRNGVTS